VPKAQQHAEEFKEAGQHIIFKGEGEEVEKAAHTSSRPTTTRSLLCLSNGHGEDTIAASILMALLVGIHKTFFLLSELLFARFFAQLICSWIDLTWTFVKCFVSVLHCNPIWWMGSVELVLQVCLWWWI
jgi:hypothetical protein